MIDFFSLMLSATIDRGIDLIVQIAHNFSLFWFVTIGSFVEEVIAPIPSPFVMTLAGSLSAAQQQTVLYLIWWAVVGAFAKTAGSWFVYVIADKAEDFIIAKFGKFIGVDQEDVEDISALLNKGTKDAWIMFFLRAIPIIPTAPVSVVSGLLKFNMRTFILASFWGTILRNIMYLYLGYSGIATLEALNAGFDSWETIGYLIVFVLLALVVVWVYSKRRGGGMKSLLRRLNDRFNS